jgi:protein-L-isoaspartate(D-aspartate) O-methyltransferase
MNDTSALHQALVDKMKQMGFIRTPYVEAAFRAVPRHLFLPNVPVKKAYQDDAIVTKCLDNGQPISSSSQPTLMAIMLEQLDLKVGDRILEIGAGTGYNAALMAHIVGKTGEVIALDIDKDIVENARENLDLAGFQQVKVICTDGGFGYPNAAPYDRIILTVGAWDIIPAWQEQLKPNGRLLLPLTLKQDVEVTVAFDLADGYLVSTSVNPCGFMKLRGAFAKPQVDKQANKKNIYRLKKLLKTALFLPTSILPVETQIQLYTLQKFGRPSLNNLRIRAYPKDTNYTATANESVIVKHWTQLILDWI